MCIFGKRGLCGTTSVLVGISEGAGPYHAQHGETAASFSLLLARPFSREVGLSL